MVTRMKMEMEVGKTYQLLQDVILRPDQDRTGGVVSLGLFRKGLRFVVQSKTNEFAILAENNSGIQINVLDFMVDVLDLYFAEIP